MKTTIKVKKGRIIIPDSIFVTKDSGIKLKGVRWDKRGFWHLLASPRNIKLVNRTFKGSSIPIPKKSGLSAIPPEIANFPFKTKPYEHQLKALAEAVGKIGHGYFMDPGLGKTWTSINEAQIMHQQGDVLDVMVICPKTIVNVWAKEIKKHGYYEDWEVYAWDLGFIHEPKDKPTMRWFIINVESLLIPNRKEEIDGQTIEIKEAMKGLKAAYNFMLSSIKLMIILDESTSIKNYTANRTEQIRKLRRGANYRRELTGTLISRDALDAYSQLDFLDSSYVNGWSYYAFRNHFCVMGGYKDKQVIGHQNLDDLQDLVAAAGTVITHADVGNKLKFIKPKYEVRTIELGPKAKKLYSDILKQTITKIDKKIIVTAELMITKMTKLQQICGGTIIGDNGNKIMDAAKVKEALHLLEEGAGSTLMWCQFTQEIDMLRDILTKKGYSVTIMSGEQNLEERAIAEEEFQTEQTQILLVQNDTGEMGITLTAAQTVIFYSNSWKWKTRKQSQDRCGLRIGQKKLVSYYDFLTKGLMDQLIYESLSKKKDLSEYIMGMEAEDLLRRLQGTL